MCATSQKSVWTEQAEKAEGEESRRSRNGQPDTTYLQITSSEQKENLETLQRVQGQPGNGLDNEGRGEQLGKIIFANCQFVESIIQFSNKKGRDVHQSIKSSDF